MWRKFTTKKLLLIVILAAATNAFGQDSLALPKKRAWYLPDFVSTQYAGSIGFVSVGAGYSVLNKKASVEFLFGYVPESIAGRHLETATFKFTAAPWSFRVNERFSVQPFTTGVYFCYTFGREFSHDLPGWYPEGYYWWSEAVRVNIFIGSNGRYMLPKSKHIERLDFYYELGTNEIKLVSYAQNRDALNVGQILHLGIGMRVYFRG